MQLDLPPDVIGHMAGLGGTDEPFEMCPSCQRAIIYGTLLYAGAAGTELEDARAAISPLSLSRNPAMALAHVDKATEMVKGVIRALIEFAKTDFASQCSIVEEMADGDYDIAIRAFHAARTAHYTDPDTGAIIFEPHGDEDEDDGTAAATS